MRCPKCGSVMSCGAPHADGDVAQRECHNCGYIERIPASQEAEQEAMMEGPKRKSTSKQRAYRMVERLLDELIDVAMERGKIFENRLVSRYTENEAKIIGIKSRLLAALAPAGWISVKDRMPEIGTPVVAVLQGSSSKRRVLAVLVRVDDDDHDWETVDDGSEISFSFDVVLWMPVPEPPDRKAGE